jgi:hypothetical protein
VERPTALTEFSTMLPLEYVEIGGSVRGAMVDAVSADGPVILSIREIPTDTPLNVRIFYASDFEFDSLKAVATLVAKGPHAAGDWKGHKYGLEGLHITQEDPRKVENPVNNRSKVGKTSGMRDAPRGIPHIEMATHPPFPNSDLPKGLNGECKYYQDGKCRKTGGFCDLCQTEDAMVLG